MAQIKTNQYSIADDAITLAKMASGTDGNIITYDASGNPAVVASGTSGHFLKSQGADTVPVFAAAGGGITAASEWRMNTSFSGSVDPVINWSNSNNAGYGTIGSNMSESSGVFTFPSTGIWWIFFHANFDDANASPQTSMHNYIQTTVDDGSNWVLGANGRASYTGSNARHSSECTFMFDVTDTSNCKVAFKIDIGGTTDNTLGASNLHETWAAFIRLGDT